MTESKTPRWLCCPGVTRFGFDAVHAATSNTKQSAPLRSRNKPLGLLAQIKACVLLPDRIGHVLCQHLQSAREQTRAYNCQEPSAIRTKSGQWITIRQVIGEAQNAWRTSGLTAQPVRSIAWNTSVIPPMLAGTGRLVMN